MSARETTDTQRVAVFDTTLRDGEQAAGVCFSPADKVEIARALDDMRVDVIEAGFPGASQAEQQAVAAVAEHVVEAEVCALARATGSGACDTCGRSSLSRIRSKLPSSCISTSTAPAATITSITRWICPTNASVALPAASTLPVRTVRGRVGLFAAFLLVFLWAFLGAVGAFRAAFFAERRFAAMVVTCSRSTLWRRARRAPDPYFGRFIRDPG